MLPILHIYIKVKKREEKHCEHTYSYPMQPKNVISI